MGTTIPEEFIDQWDRKVFVAESLLTPNFTLFYNPIKERACVFDEQGRWTFCKGYSNDWADDFTFVYFSFSESGSTN